MRERIVFIDLLRGWATLVMIEVHVFNAFLSPEAKASAWFGVLNFINGLVAPAFLFVAGLVFSIAAGHTSDVRGLFRRQIGRIVLIWMIGYVLHLPIFSFRTITTLPSDKWLTFYQSDILHCIAAGLLTLLTLRVVVGSSRLLLASLVFLTLFFIGGTAVLESTRVAAGLHPAIRAYVDPDLSLFPLFPWLGFMLAGGAIGTMYVRRANGESDVRFAGNVAIGAIGLIVLSLPEFLGILLPISGARSSPWFVALRLGMTMLLLLTCRQWVQMRKTSSSFVLDAGRESLLIYVGHLLILYGTFLGGRSLVDLFGGAGSVLLCVAGTVVLVWLMVFAARSWSALKRRSRSQARRAAMVAAALAIAVFFLQ
jgi:uncharacterized membrane protein